MATASKDQMTKKNTESTAITVSQPDDPPEPIKKDQEEAIVVKVMKNDEQEQTPLDEISKGDEVKDNDSEKPPFRFQKVEDIDAQTMFHLGLEFVEFGSPDVFLNESLLKISSRKANKSYAFLSKFIEAKNKADNWHPPIVVHDHGNLKVFDCATILESDIIESGGREMRREKTKREAFPGNVAVNASAFETPNVETIEIQSIIKGAHEKAITLDRHKNARGPTVEDIIAIRKAEEDDEIDDDNREGLLRDYLRDTFSGEPLIEAVKDYASFRILDAVTAGELIQQHKFTPRQFTDKLTNLYYNIVAACRENGEIGELVQQQLKSLKQRIEKLMAFAAAADLNIIEHVTLKPLEKGQKAEFEDLVKKRYKKKKEAFDEFTADLRKPQEKNEDESESDDDSYSSLDLEELIRTASNTAPHRTPVPIRAPRKRKAISSEPNLRKRQATTNQPARTVTPDGQSTAAIEYVRKMDLNSFATPAAVHQAWDGLSNVLTSDGGGRLSNSDILSFAKLKMEMSSKVDTLNRRLSIKSILSGRIPLFTAGFLPSFDSELDYRHPEYTTPMLALMECPKSNLPQHLSELRRTNKWPAVPTTTMMINVLHRDGWKGASHPLSGLHIAGFVPTSTRAYASLFNNDGIEKPGSTSDLFNDVELAKKIYVPTLWSELVDMVSSLIAFVKTLMKASNCIIIMGHVWLLKTLTTFRFKINERLTTDKYLLAKIIWWFEEKQLDFTTQLTEAINDDSTNKNPLYGLGDELLAQFEDEFNNTFGRFQISKVCNAVCPPCFKKNLDQSNGGATIDVNNERGHDDDDGSTNNKAPFDWTKRNKDLHPGWRLLHNKTWEDVFNDNEEGKVNTEILPLISHHSIKKGKFFISRRPCTKFFWRGNCDKGKKCEQSHRLYLTRPQQAKVTEAVSTINLKYE